MFARTLVRSVAKKVPARSMGGHGGHGGHSHYDHGLPKWIQALEEAPRAQVIGASIGVSLVLSGLFWSILMARGEHVHTLSDDWKKANKEYMKFQNMNPIFGISSHK